MADEVHYGSDSNKRKYDDNQTPPPPRRQTRFSAPISSLSPADSSLGHQASLSYNRVLLPMDEIELAKQKAQEIADRIVKNAEATKRPRVEKGGGGGGGSGFDSMEPVTQKPLGLSNHPSMPSSYGYPGPSKKIEIPNGRVGVIIGKGGETIKHLQSESGAKIQVTKDMDADPLSPTRGVELMGTREQISKAEQLIKDVLREVEKQRGKRAMENLNSMGETGPSSSHIANKPESWHVKRRAVLQKQPPETLIMQEQLDEEKKRTQEAEQRDAYVVEQLNAQKEELTSLREGQSQANAKLDLLLEEVSHINKGH